MTAVKEQFMQMLPQSLQGVPDDEVQYMINILVKWNKPDEPQHADIANSGLSDEGRGYKIPSIEQRKKALEGLMKYCGSVEPTDDFDADKENYLRSKYESLT